ncbi:MAG: RNA-directed DNA polymerase, partial [Bacilli bacterium]|nr:RNA-directed DNA polymerase [Bacilli bacterium]
YYLKCDIRKYFPSINHDILLNLLKKVNFSNDEMWLIEKYVRSKPSSYNCGLPLGNQTSQWFALFYFDMVDRHIKEKLRVKHYIRYMDDMILVSRDKEYLKYCLDEIRKICEIELNLLLNNKTQIGKVSNGIDFLGFRNVLTSSGKVVRKLRQSSKIRMKKHLKTLEKLYNKNIIDKEYVNMRKKAYSEHIKVSNESKLLKKKLICD